MLHIFYDDNDIKKRNFDVCFDILYVQSLFLFLKDIYIVLLRYQGIQNVVEDEFAAHKLEEIAGRGGSAKELHASD